MTVPAPGSQIGPYEIVREIGRGEMGLVDLARDTRLRRAVAVKVLPVRLADDADVLALLKREDAITAALPESG